MDVLEVTVQLHELADEIAQRLAGPIAAANLTSATAYALDVIDPDRDPLTMSDLATRLGCNPSNATFIVAQLEREGYVQRTADSSDARRRVVGLTAEGRRVRTALRADLAAISPLIALSAEELNRLSLLLAKAAG